MATITGKQSISRAISSRLSRARTRSRDVLNANGGVIIGVAVQEATVEHHSDDLEFLDDKMTTVVKSTVEVPVAAGEPGVGVGVLRRQRSTPKLDGHQGGQQSSWMVKAKELTSRFKRKSMAALSQVS